jgi:hypothetical protein
VVVSGEGRWWGSGLTCSCAPNDDVVVVVLLSLTARGLRGSGKEGGDLGGGSGGGELVSSERRWGGLTCLLAFVWPRRR